MVKDNPLEGSTITEVRTMTDEEMEREGWYDTMHGRPTVLVLDDGRTLYPSQDPEGNGGGALFGTNTDGELVAFYSN